MNGPISSPTGGWPARRSVRTRLRDAFLRNASLKVFSLALALVAWVLVQEEQTEDQEATARITYQWPEELVLTSPSVDSARIRVTGSRTSLKNLGSRKLAIQLDLRDATPGVTSFSLVGQPVRDLPQDLRVVSVSPPSLQLTFDEKASRRLPVRPVARGAPKGGYEIRGVRADPPDVALEGAREVLEAMTEVATLAIDVKNRDAPFHVDVGLDLRGKRAWPQAESQVKVSVDIGPSISEHTYVGVPVSAEGGESMRVEPERVDVVLRGPADVLAAARAEGLRAEVRLPDAVPSGMDSGPVEAPWGAPEGQPRLVIVPPEGAEVVRVEPDRVSVSRTRG
ncbi:hypothetical protein L6R50_24300 [Myxococcota bacterium]|nr:hypothetical protein [Myxococcota bacterium]